jgi:AcrR family transcriptional regulator
MPAPSEFYENVDYVYIYYFILPHTLTMSTYSDNITQEAGNGMDGKKKAYHHVDLRKKLIAAAARIIAKKGADALTLRDLAWSCGVSRTAPYRHFSDKAALLAAVAEEGFLGLAAVTRNARTVSGGDPERALKDCFLAYVDFAQEHPTQYRLMFGRQIRSLFDHPDLAAAARTSFDELMAVVIMGQETGVLGKGRTLETAYLLWSQAHGLSMLLIDGLVVQVEDIRRFMEFACHSLLRGIPLAGHEYNGKQSGVRSRSA